jgi:hypothetical protein
VPEFSANPAPASPESDPPRGIRLVARSSDGQEAPFPPHATDLLLKVYTDWGLCGAYEELFRKFPWQSLVKVGEAYYCGESGTFTLEFYDVCVDLARQHDQLLAGFIETEVLEVATLEEARIYGVEWTGSGWRIQVADPRTEPVQSALSTRDFVRGQVPVFSANPAVDANSVVTLDSWCFSANPPTGVARPENPLLLVAAPEGWTGIELSGVSTPDPFALWTEHLKEVHAAGLLEARRRAEARTAPILRALTALAKDSQERLGIRIWRYFDPSAPWLSLLKWKDGQLWNHTEGIPSSQVYIVPPVSYGDSFWHAANARLRVGMEIGKTGTTQLKKGYEKDCVTPLMKRGSNRRLYMAQDPFSPERAFSHVAPWVLPWSAPMARVKGKAFSSEEWNTLFSEVPEFEFEEDLPSIGSLFPGLLAQFSERDQEESMPDMTSGFPSIGPERPGPRLSLIPAAGPKSGGWFYTLLYGLWDEPAIERGSCGHLMCRLWPAPDWLAARQRAEDRLLIPALSERTR